MVGIWASIMGIWLAEVWRYSGNKDEPCTNILIYKEKRSELDGILTGYEPPPVEMSEYQLCEMQRQPSSRVFNKKRRVHFKVSGGILVVHIPLAILSSFSAFVGPWKKHWFCQLCGSLTPSRYVRHQSCPISGTCVDATRADWKGPKWSSRSSQTIHCMPQTARRSDGRCF